MRALYTAATGMAAQQLKIDNIANNLANVNTTAFKRGREDFQDLFYQQLRSTGLASELGDLTPVGVNIGHGVRTGSIEKQFTQGVFVQTQNELDLAIEGDGFFRVEMPTGEWSYTRAGNFKRNSNGEIVTLDGFKLMPGFAIPQNTVSLSISRDGVISVVEDGRANSTALGSIELVRFINPGGLESMGRNLYQETETSGQPIFVQPDQDGAGTLVQGFLESSNVDVAEEMVQMIVAQRSFEATSKVMRSSDEMMRYTNQLIR